MNRLFIDDGGIKFYCIGCLNKDYYYVFEIVNNLCYLSSPMTRMKVKHIIHRMDGPAIVYTNGNKYWYYFGKQIFCKTQEEFEKILRMKAFI